jgi:preprotein translocase subunit SecG
VFFGVVVFHVIIAIALILVVLMQSSKGEALAGSAFGGGGGGGGGSFGGARVPFLSKVTTVLAIIFMLNSIGLTLLSAQNRPILGGQPDPNAKSIVTERMQKEIQANQPPAGAVVDTFTTEDAALNLDSLVQVQPTDTSTATESSSEDPTQDR